MFFLAGARGHPPRHERAAHAATTRRGACVIAGGGNIGFRLARTLEKHNQVKLIERDATRARRVSELLENTIVLNGDAADEELLIEENIDSADVFAASPTPKKPTSCRPCWPSASARTR